MYGMYGIRNPFREYLEIAHPPRIIIGIFRFLLIVGCIKWVFLFLFMPSSGQGLELWSYFNAAEILLIPLFPIVSAVLIANYVAQQRKKDFFESVLLTALDSKQIFWAFVRTLAPIYLGIVVLIELDVLMLFLWIVVGLQDQFTADTSDITKGFLIFLAYFFFLWQPFARGIQIIGLLVGIHLGLVAKRPLYAVTASAGLGILLTGLIGFLWVVWIRLIEDNNTEEVAYFWVTLFNVMLWGVAFFYARRLPRAVREV
jgi:hypothetical protein